MDCVRVSTQERNDQEYMGMYNLASEFSGSGFDACRQSCVSNLNCKAWKYNPDNECYLSNKLHGSYPMHRIARPGTKSGLIECKNDWNMLKLILMITVLGLILVLFWYLMSRGEMRRSKGNTFFPRFYFSGPN